MHSLQGRVAAVSRVIGRDQLPLRGWQQRDSPVPCHDVESHNGPAFLIQSCGGSGGGRDWAVVRGNLDAEGRVFPEIYRQSTPPANSNPLPRTAHAPTVSSIHPLNSLLSSLDIRVAAC